MTNTMEESPLWQRIFAKSDDPNVERLVTSLRSARERVGQLTKRIASSLPNLTVHDLSHLDGLWTVASTITGDEFFLNPLEGYLFGTAVLLHDTALCFEAYSGGKKAVRDTIQWRDANKRRRANRKSVDHADVDFEALRNLHALRAASLAIKPWNTDDDPVYIIDDADLRNQYGQLIGKIASSHHWNIDDVVDQFSVVRPPAAFLPHKWTVDPLMIACLLRTADAGHIDSSRAPTFLLKILEMNTITRAHWTAQNHLGHLTVNQDDPSQIVVASTSPFQESETAGWWVAFDLVSQLDKELRQCHAVLSSKRGLRRTFACRTVVAANNVRELTKYIQVDGWEPTSSSVHVSDVAALVESLGGEQLYGTDADPLNIALRELIQNAADAISARRLIGRQPDFTGHIKIALRRNSEKSSLILQVDDNGIGMSTRTLSNELLDFGSSFWASERASREFPGLHAAGHSPRGRFGIGFFSIFMAASSVRVFSRRFDSGIENVRCLSFPNGLSLRPTISDKRPEDFSMDICTRVELVLKPTVISSTYRIRIERRLKDYNDIYVSFDGYVAALVCGIDVPISVEIDGERTQIHQGFPPNPADQAEWLRKLSYDAVGAIDPAEELIAPITNRLRGIYDDTNCYGFAAIRTKQSGLCDFLSAKSIGGITDRDHFHSNEAFVGMIDYLPRSAKRDPGEIAAPRSAVKSWVSEQVAILNGRLSPKESIFASYSLCDFDYDAIKVLQAILVITLDGEDLWPLRNLSTLLSKGNRLGFRVSRASGRQSLETWGEQHTIDDISTCLVVNTGKFNEAEMSPLGPTKPNTLVGIVHRTLVAQGKNPTWSTHPGLYQGTILGRCDCLEVRI